MLKNAILAAACVAALSITAPVSSAMAADEATASSTTDQQALDAEILAVEALVEQYQDDADGLEAAIESRVVGASNPELAAQAVLVVFDNSKNPNIVAILQKNSGLKSAAGRALGAAVVALGITNPGVAASVSAIVSGSGDQAMIDSAQTGADTKTASVNQERKQQRESSSQGESNDSTPENDLSPTTI